MNVLPNLLIFSVFNPARTEQENTQIHTEILKNLKETGTPVKELHGVFEGQHELSILVMGFEHRDLVEMLMREHNQLSYLESHNDRESYLVFPGLRNERVSLGKLLSVSPITATRTSNYSYDPEANTYWTTTSELVRLGGSDREGTTTSELVRLGGSDRKLAGGAHA